ncbi:hypothetical protein [Streptomyces sp. NPDC057748]|uniref:hypothetical protein n=1 Tax=unclassified Streptomyces TaxID=2593676 RepID=UPI0036B5E16D
MPKNDSYGQNVPYPVLSDAPNIETAFQAAVNGLVALSVLRFANANERAATLVGSYAPRPGMITYLIAEDRWEARQVNGSWLLLSDGPWQPLTFKSGYAAHAGSPGWRRKAGGGIELRGRIRRSNNGNLDDSGELISFASIPAAVAPASNRPFVMPTKRITSGGITRHTARVEVTIDGTLTYYVEAGAGVSTSDAVAWFGLDGIQFSPAGD